MVTKATIPTPKPKRLAQGQRKHIRRMKQAARKAGTSILTVRTNVP